MSFALAAPDRLLARYQRTGNPRALGKLFDRTAPELLRVAGWLCGNRADAEDVLQRTFVTVIETRGAFDATRRALPWLCGIVGNHAKKLHEQRQRRVAPTGERAGERDPAHAAADAEFAATVARLRSELGSPYAEVLDLHLGEGLNAKEIAARLGRPAGTVRTQLVRALDLLRRQLPAGFAAGLALSASATASSLATVRAAVVPGGATATAFTFGGLLMGKKIAVVVPALVLLLGGGTWALVDSNDAAPVRAEAPQLAVAGTAAQPPADHGAEPPAPATLRAVVAANDLAPDADTATLVVRATWQHDGSPATGIGVLVMPQRPRVRVFERDGLTGDDGSVVVRGIQPASYAVASPYSDAHFCELAAGSVTTIDLRVRRDAFVRGIVVDGDDRPVPDARLWLSDRATWARGFEMARSDANGRFELPLRDDHYVGARKAGWAPSRLRYLWPVPTSDVTLRLSSLGGAVRGRVLRTDGAPIAGAIVEVGQQGGHVVPGGTIRERYLQPTPEALRTDANGAFFADGVAGGSTGVRAWADGHASVLQQVDVAIGRTSDVVLMLPRAATIEGTVRDDKQRPVAKASVSVGDWDQFGSVRTQSDEAGDFRLEHVSAGAVQILAKLGPAHALATLQLEAGRVATWNPVLGTRQLAGTLVGPAGAPIAGYEIGTFGDGAQVESATTDASGRFTLAGMRGASVDLVVSLRGMGIAQRNGVAVDETDLVLRLTDAEVPSATIRGRIVDERGNGLPKAVSVMNAATSFATRVEASLDGTFVCDTLPAGTWWLSVDGHPFGSVRLPPVGVSAGENRVLPDVVLLPPGRVELVLRGADVPSGGLVMFVRDDGTETYVKSPEGRRVAGELTCGGYTAMTQVGDLAGAVSFTVHAGKTTHAELVLAPSVPIAVEFQVMPSPRPGETLRTVARDAAGNVVGAGILDFRVRQPDGRSRLRFRVPPGPCVLDARHSDGRSATTAFTAAPTGASEQAVVVQLPSK
ncbi:MAG TPA: sigma-70 family RNA polymerase sigma factor [Planctomycetota bacterium]|nr:sigma-70 family RNA polymerase sigma factor [Planctomycetota bacterium]